MPAFTSTIDHVPLTLEQRLRLGVKLLHLRRDRSLTVAQVAKEALGYARSHAGVSRLERGVLPAVSVHQLGALSRFFQTDLQAFTSEWQNTHFNAYAPVELGPHSLARVLQLQGALRFGGQAQDRMKRFDSMLPPELLSSWVQETDNPDLTTLDRLSKYFDLTRSWLPSGL